MRERENLSLNSRKLVFFAPDVVSKHLDEKLIQDRKKKERKKNDEEKKKKKFRIVLKSEREFRSISSTCTGN